jgi:hypothetical protein
MFMSFVPMKCLDDKYEIYINRFQAVGHWCWRRRTMLRWRRFVRLLERVARVIRARGYAIRTEQTYLHWILRYLGSIGRREATDAGAMEVATFLEYLAVERKVSASTQNLALNALVFLYRELLGHADVSTTMIYTHVLNRGGKGVKSPLDALV